MAIQRAMSYSLVSTQNRVESPFIIVQIGNYTFGHCERKETKENLKTVLRVDFPNYMEGMSVVKTNGAINTYTINMVYAITENDDPNKLEKIFSSVSKGRTLTLKYGDWNQPDYIYKDEEALITKVASNIDFNASKIKYTITCTSTAIALKSVVTNFPTVTAQPSEEIVKLLKNQDYGLLSIFKGMSNATANSFSNFIARDDRTVEIQGKTGISPLDYLGYLVRCMVSNDDSNSGLKKSNYYWSIYDDINNQYGGTYFKVQKVTANTQYNISYDTYEVNVGYPSGEYITSFTLNNDSSWSILYDYATEVNNTAYQYTINNKGELETILAPKISSKTLEDDAVNRTWWTQMTQFPVQAKLVIKGLLRPAMLMSYVKVNSYFYGHKHISSGLYIITRQEDRIDGTGYKTTLSLTRVSGDTKMV